MFAQGSVNEPEMELAGEGGGWQGCERERGAELGHRFGDQTKSDTRTQVGKEWIGAGGLI